MPVPTLPEQPWLPAAAQQALAQPQVAACCFGGADPLSSLLQVWPAQSHPSAPATVGWAAPCHEGSWMAAPDAAAPAETRGQRAGWPCCWGAAAAARPAQPPCRRCHHPLLLPWQCRCHCRPRVLLWQCCVPNWRALQCPPARVGGCMGVYKGGYRVACLPGMLLHGCCNAGAAAFTPPGRLGTKTRMLYTQPVSCLPAASAAERPRRPQRQCCKAPPWAPPASGGVPRAAGWTAGAAPAGCAVWVRGGAS